MAVGCSLTVDRAAQIEGFDYAAGCKLKILSDQFGDLFIVDGACAEGVNQNGNRLCDADGVSQLDLNFFCKACGYDVLCSISGCIARGAVDLCGILAGKCSAAVASVSAVGIDDDLSSGKT